MSVRGWVQGCEWQERGSELTADTAAGGTVLHVEDVTDFDDAAGVFLLNGELHQYADNAVDEDAGTITSDTPLAADASLGDKVYAVSGGQVMQDVVLFVSCGDGDAVEVVVPFSQRDYWPESDSYEDPVQIVLSNDLEQILEVPGRMPESMSAGAAVEAADDAMDQAEDALTKAQLAQAIIDGEIEYHYVTSAPWANGSSAHDADLGDVWVDTDSIPQQAYRWLNRTWTLISDGSLVAALFAAQDAQTTADGKITHFIGSSTPVAEGYGDIWTNTAQDNTKYYWNGSAWVALILGDDGIASVLIGKTLVAGAAQFSGERLILRLDGSGGILEAFSGLSGESPGYFNPSASGSKPAVSIAPGATGTYGARPSIVLVSEASGAGSAFLNAVVNLVYGGTATGDINMNSSADVVLGSGSQVTGSGSIDVGGDIHGDEIYSDGLASSATAGTVVHMGLAGRLYKFTSSKRRKKNIKDAEIDVRKVLSLRPRRYQARRGHAEKGREDDWMIGLIAEEVEAAGLSEWVGYDAQGRTDSVAYDRLTVALLAVDKAQDQQITKQAAQIAELTAQLAEVRASLALGDRWDGGSRG